MVIKSGFIAFGGGYCSDVLLYFGRPLEKFERPIGSTEHLTKTLYIFICTTYYMWEASACLKEKETERVCLRYPVRSCIEIVKTAQGIVCSIVIA